MADVSRIDEVVDQTAAVAAAFVTGLKAVYGVGCEKVTIPAGGIMAGMLVPAYPGSAMEDGVWVSDMPDAPTIHDWSATVTELTWRVPFRIYLNLAFPTDLRRRASKFYSPILTAFSQHKKLYNTLPGGSVGVASFVLFSAAADGFDGLGGVLEASERLDLENAP